MAILETNVRQVNADFQAIKSAIVESGVEVADGTKTEEYASKIGEVYDAGKQAEHDAFWISALSNTNPIGKFAGKCWNNDTFKPNKSIVMEGNLSYTFYCSGIRGSLPKIAEDLGITITIKPTQTTGTFHYCSLTEVEIDCINATTLSSAFGYTTSLETLTLKNVKSTCIWTSSFLSCEGLKNLTVTGTIGQNISFADCPLTEESAYSVADALADYEAFSNTKKITISSDTERNLNYDVFDDDGVVAYNQLEIFVWTCNSKGWKVEVAQ